MSKRSQPEHAPSMFQDVVDFHKKFGIAYAGKPRVLPKGLQKFRDKFAREELTEYRHSIEALYFALKNPKASFDDEVAHNLEHALDALVDLTYVVLGTAHLHGFDFDAAWRRVHAANMAKVKAKSAKDSKRKSTHDVVKPPGWKAPRHRDLVVSHAHL